MARFLCALVLLAAAIPPAAADWVTSYTLLKDINPGATGSSPGAPVRVGSGVVVFAANDGTHGEELWITDVTTAGTVLLKDIAPGAAGSSPTGLRVVGSVAYFRANDGVNGAELWKTDGTAAGTVMVADINPGAAGSNPTSIVAIGGTIYFNAETAAGGRELWKSDGTAAGTAMVADIMPGPGESNPLNLTVLDSTLYFTASTSAGRELWKSDGTAAGTVQVKDIRAGNLGSSPSTLVAVGYTLFFAATDGVSGIELWKSDGTAAGTVAVKDIVAGAAGSLPTDLVAHDGALYFVANDGVNGSELWTSDGTAAGTVMVMDIRPGASGSSPSALTSAGAGTPDARLYFSADDGTHGRELWVRTAAGVTKLVQDINPGAGSFPNALLVVEGLVYFRTNDGTHGAELWWSNGDSATMVFETEVGSGTHAPVPLLYEPFQSGYRMLVHSVGPEGAELWVRSEYYVPPVLHHIDCWVNSHVAGLSYAGCNSTGSTGTASVLPGTYPALLSYDNLQVRPHRWEPELCDGNVTYCMIPSSHGRSVRHYISWGTFLQMGGGSGPGVVTYPPTDGGTTPRWWPNPKIVGVTSPPRRLAMTFAPDPGAVVVATGTNCPSQMNCSCDIAAGTCEFDVPAAESPRYFNFSVIFGYTLALQREGAGSGSLAASSAQRNASCSQASCSAPFEAGASVTVVPTPAVGSVFTGWGGACSGTGSCVVTLDAARSVTATFALQSLPLTVTKAGGAGTVTSTPGGIACGAVCGANFTFGTMVTLVATASPGAIFVGWSGACTGVAPCELTMDAARSVQANFAAGPGALSISPSSIDFGGQSMGTTSDPQTVTVTNIGGSGVQLTSLASSQAQFVVTHDCAALAPGASCTAAVSFAPALAAGALNAGVPVVSSLQVASNAPGSPQALALAGVAEKSLVTHYYNAILNRLPDSAGKDYWQGEAARLAGLGVNVNETWFVMAGYFFNSAEYASFNRTHAEFVGDLYLTFFNRVPDQGGLDFWVGQVNAGLPREVVLFSFMFSNEFGTFTQGIFGNTASRPEVDMVVDLFRGVLNRLPDTASLNYWLGRIRAAQCSGAGAVYQEVDAMSHAFIFNPEYGGRGRNYTQFVTDMYYSFLRRGGDLAGVQFWINELTTGARDVNGVRASFIGSPEFGARVQAIIAAGCSP